MRMRALFLASVAATFGTLATFAPSAVAGPPQDGIKEQCIQANTAAQDLRRDHKLSAAREQLRKCGDPACPAIIRDDCVHRFDEVEQAQPTIIFDTKDGSGHDLTAVRVTMDGKPLADKIDGSALTIDPGEHAFTFTTAGQPPVERTFVLKEGEKGRRERIVIGPVSAEQDAGGARPDGASRGSSMRLAGFIVGGAGIVGVAVGSIFGVSAISSNNASNSNGHCDATGCDPDGVSLRNSARTDATVSTIAFIAGGALLATGVTLLVLAPSSKKVGRVDVAPMVGARAAGVSLGGAW